MFLIDDILLFPIKGILSVFREIHKATEQDVENEGDAIRAKLSDLYMILETGGLTADEFDLQEKELLDRLDEIEALRTANDAQKEDEDEDEDEKDEDQEVEEKENEADIGIQDPIHG